MQPQKTITAPTACRLSLDEQFAALAKLQDGWYNGSGTAYPVEILDRVRAVVASLMRDADVPVPYLYPTQDGEVRVEWPLSDSDVLVEIDEKAANAFAIVMFNGEDDSRDVEGQQALDEAGLRAIAEMLKPHFADPSRRIA